MYKEINFLDVNENITRLFAEDWAILTGGSPDGFNSMTVSWGMAGELWGKPVATAFVRPHRYTNVFMEKSDFFTLAFYDAKYKNALGIFGSKSGRDTDKYALTGFTALTDGDWVYPDNAKLILFMKKIAVQEFKNEGFLDTSIEENYPKKDYHLIYFGEIVKTLIKE